MLEQNLIRIYESSFRENAQLPALTDYFKKDDAFTYLQVGEEIAKLHLLFRELGIATGDKISLIGRNNPRWCIAYMATITYGAVIVPILQDFNPNDIHHIINHSDSKLLFCGDTFWDSIEAGQIADVKAVFSLTDFRCLYERDGDTATRFRENVALHMGERYPAGFSVEDITYPEVPNEQVVLINYTSGTTGFSKGVMVRANNLAANIVFLLEQQVRKRGCRALVFLPLAHTYGCTVDMLYSLAVGTHLFLLGKTPAPKLLLEAMNEVKPSIVVCVPLILEKICRKQVFPEIGKGFLKYALKVPVLGARINAKICQQLLQAFGGEVEQFIVGGAPLNSEVEDFLLKIKFPITVGYGMTECTPLISFEHYHKFKASSCGTILTRMEAKIDSSDPRRIPGEIMVRGECVMAGYYKNQQATDEVLEPDGWLHTGDMGTLDEDNTLYIRGRCKSMILGASGQNIYPEEIEAKLNNLYCVNESLVIERDGKLVALVVPDYEQADADGFNGDKLPGVMTDNLAALNQQVAAYERVSEIILYPNEFEKTPKKSIKRYLYNT